MQYILEFKSAYLSKTIGPFNTKKEANDIAERLSVGFDGDKSWQVKPVYDMADVFIEVLERTKDANRNP